MHNLTKIASLPQGGGCKAALVGEVQSVEREPDWVVTYWRLEDEKPTRIGVFVDGGETRTKVLAN